MVANPPETPIEEAVEENEQSENGDSDSWTNIDMDDDDVDTSDSMNTGSMVNNECRFTDIPSDAEDDDETTVDIIDSETIFNRTVFTYRKVAQLIVRDCSFSEAIRFEFHNSATVKFLNCQFYGSKMVIFHGTVSSLYCQNVQCFGPAMYKHHEDVVMKFHQCTFFGSKECGSDIANFQIEETVKQSASTQTATTKILDFEPVLRHMNETSKKICCFSE